MKVFGSKRSIEYETALRNALNEIKSELKMEKEHNEELTKSVNKLKIYIEHNRGSLDKCESVFKGQLAHLKKREASLKDCVAAANAAYEAKDAEFRKETDKYNEKVIELVAIVSRIKEENSFLKDRKRFYFF